MASNSSTVSTGKQRNKSGGVHNTLVYVKQHWELYVIFLLPALALTLIFKYIPMGGILLLSRIITHSRVFWAVSG